MGLYQNDSGVLTPIAGRGRAEYGASTIRSGKATLPNVAANNYSYVQITFDEPMPDADYIISLQNMSNGWCTYISHQKTVNGFRIYAVDTQGAAQSNVEVDWVAYKLYTNTEYNNLVALTHYSTTEQLVGTWIDGKPLYQLTFTMKTPASVSATTTYNLSAYNIDKIISEDAMLQRTSNDYDHGVNWHYNNNNHDMCTYFNFNTGLYYITKTSGAADTNADAYITLKYTKK